MKNYEFHITHKDSDFYLRGFLFKNELDIRNNPHPWEIMITSQVGTDEWGITKLKAVSEDILVEIMQIIADHAPKLRLSRINRISEDETEFETLSDYWWTKEEYTQKMINFGWENFMGECPRVKILTQIQVAFPTFTDFALSLDFVGLAMPLMPTDYTDEDWLDLESELTNILNKQFTARAN